MSFRRASVIFWGVSIVLMAAMFAAVLAFSDDPEPAPYGCAWVDMNPSKGADYQLACVPGHQP